MLLCKEMSSNVAEASIMLTLACGDISLDPTAKSSAGGRGGTYPKCHESVGEKAVEVPFVDWYEEGGSKDWRWN